MHLHPVWRFNEQPDQPDQRLAMTLPPLVGKVARRSLDMLCWCFHLPHRSVLRHHNRVHARNRRRACKRVRDRQEARENWKKRAPPSLVRARSLTPPCALGTEERASYGLQTSILHRLPPELRRLIYQAVLGGDVLHLTTHRHPPTWHSPDEAVHHRYGTTLRAGGGASGAGAPRGKRLLSLLKTCRQV